MSPVAAFAGVEGSWVPVAAAVSGQPLDVDELRVARFVLDRGGYEIIDRANHVVDSGDYRVDATVSPWSMDIIGVSGPNAGRTMLAIFELQGDRLTVCYDLEAASRPQDMQPLEDQLLLVITYQRAARRLS